MDQFEAIQFSPAQITGFREAYNLSRAQVKSSGSVDMGHVYAAQFQYGHALVQSTEKGDIKRGIDELKDLVRNHHESTSRRDYTYFIGIGYYRLRDDEAVIREMKKILTFEPKNHQAQNLMKASEKRLQRDGLIGIGVAGGIAAVGAAVIGGILAAKRH